MDKRGEDTGELREGIRGDAVSVVMKHLRSCRAAGKFEVRWRNNTCQKLANAERHVTGMIEIVNCDR